MRSMHSMRGGFIGDDDGMCSREKEEERRCRSAPTISERGCLLETACPRLSVAPFPGSEPSDSGSCVVCPGCQVCYQVVVAAPDEYRYSAINRCLTASLSQPGPRYAMRFQVGRRLPYCLVGFAATLPSTRGTSRYVHAVSLRGTNHLPAAAPGGSCGLTYVSVPWHNFCKGPRLREINHHS
jgi:hypothetical protein